MGQNYTASQQALIARLARVSAGTLTEAAFAPNVFAPIKERVAAIEALGDHRAQGYLTDVTGASHLQGQKADEAHSWGNHALAGYAQGTRVCHVEERRALGNMAGGSFVSGGWVRRELNTLVSNGITGATFDPFPLDGAGAGDTSGCVMVPAGVYMVDAWASAFGVGKHVIRVRAVAVSGGVSGASSRYPGGAARAPANPTNPELRVQTVSMARAFITVAEEGRFMVQHQCETTQNTFGRGFPSGFVSAEVYAGMTIWRMPDA